MSSRDLDGLLQRMAGKKITLYPFQRKMAEAILAGKNVVAVAPTGSGKTWGAVLPFVQAVIGDCRIADRLLYALPLRTLASGLYKTTRKAIERLGSPLVTSVQTGEHQDDPFYESDICFTTIDQLLSSYLNIPVSLPKKLANINAGALVGALLVFDEIHLLDPSRARATVLEMAHRLRSCAQFVLMTATLGMEAAELLVKYLNAELVSVSDSELMEMPSHCSKARRFTWVDRPLSASEVASCHTRLLEEGRVGRSLVICNTVSRAQAMFLELEEVFAPPTKIGLLHSRFTLPDRRRGEAFFDTFFGPEATHGDAVLVTTQVVEAGVDISADELHTEICPANSLVQRAGRCARYPEPRNKGTVYVYELQVDSAGHPRLGPYREGAQAAAVEKTKQIVAGLPAGGEIWTHGKEKALLEQVHGSTEIAEIEAVVRTMVGRSQDIDRVMQLGDRSAIQGHIRDVDSVTVFVSDSPQELRTSDRPCLVSVPRVSLESLRDSAGVIARIPIEAEEDDEDGFGWREVRSITEVRSSWLAALSPSVAKYDSKTGLTLGVPGQDQIIEYRGREEWNPYAYRVETFVDHSKRVLTQLGHIHSRSTIASLRLSGMHGFSQEWVLWLAEVSCALHDAGKLSVEWQKKARLWQRERHPEDDLSERTLLSHTTKSGVLDAEYSRMSRYRFPPHALEGAVMVSEALYEALSKLGWCSAAAQDLARVVATCLARHHSPRACEIKSKIVPAEDSLDQVNSVLMLLEPPIRLSSLATLSAPAGRQEFKDNVMLSVMRDRALIPLYWHLVRTLRLSDQKSFGDLKEVNTDG